MWFNVHRYIMKKLILISLFLLPLTAYSIEFSNFNYALKTSHGEYEEVYIMPNGIMYQVDLDKLIVEQVYMNSIVLEKFQFRLIESLRDFVDSLGKKKCATLKGVDKCRTPKRTKEE